VVITSLIAVFILLFARLGLADWTTHNFKDAFGDITKDKYIQTSTEGRFSNSATFNSRCKVQLLVDQSRLIGLYIYEYNSGNAVSFIGKGYLLMKNSNGVVIRGNITDRYNRYGLLVTPNSYYHMGDIPLFLSNSIGVVKVVICDSYSSTYNFTIDTTGFTSAYTKINKKFTGEISKMDKIVISRYKVPWILYIDLSLYTSKSTSSQQLEHLERGEHIEILERFEDGWLKVKTALDKVGYIKESWISMKEVGH